jgi:copper oxidase (laccase) domain-containing protein
MSLVVAISTVEDGNMLIHEDKANQQVINNRKNFLKKHGIDIKQTSRVDVTFDTTDFKRYREVTSQDKGESMFGDDKHPADALITTQPNHALFLPLADCVGAVIYDPVKQVLMLSHIGRHSLEENGAYESVAFLVTNHSSRPEDLLVWLTPAPGKDRYPVFAFNNRGLKEVVLEQLQNAGILTNNITDNNSDTATDPRYFSHSEFLAGRRSTDGRHSIVAMMKD